MAKLGEDRGMRLNITNTTVKHSNFCKGMIVYRRQEPLDFESAPNFLNFTAQMSRDPANETNTERRDP